MKAEWICKIEQFLQGQDFGKNWDGAYQDAVPTIRRFFHKEGFRTEIVSEWNTPSRHPELVAVNGLIVVRIPWGEDANGLSLVDLNTIEVALQARKAAD
jgi:hypothetical protein